MSLFDFRGTQLVTPTLCLPTLSLHIAPAALLSNCGFPTTASLGQELCCMGQPFHPVLLPCQASPPLVFVYLFILPPLVSGMLCQGLQMAPHLLTLFSLVLDFLALCHSVSLSVLLVCFSFPLPTFSVCFCIICAAF